MPPNFLLTWTKENPNIFFNAYYMYSYTTTKNSWSAWILTDFRWPRLLSETYYKILVVLLWRHLRALVSPLLFPLRYLFLSFHLPCCSLSRLCCEQQQFEGAVRLHNVYRHEPILWRAIAISVALALLCYLYPNRACSMPFCLPQNVLWVQFFLYNFNL